MALASLSAILALLLWLLRSEHREREEDRLRVVENAARMLELHLWGDAELLEIVVARMESESESWDPRPELTEFHERQPEMIAVSLVSLESDEAPVVSSSQTEALPHARLHEAARLAPPEGHGFTPLFSCGADRCFALVQRVGRPNGAPERLVAVYCLERLLRTLQPRAGVPETGIYALGPTGLVEAHVGPRPMGRGVPAATAALSLPQPALRVAISAAPGADRGLLGLGLVVIGLCGGLGAAFVLLERENRARKEAVEEVISRGSELRSVFTSLAEGVLVFGPDGSVRASNLAAQRILGFGEGELAGRSIWAWEGSVLHEDGSPFPADAWPVVDTLRSGRPHADVAVGLRRPDGSQVWLRFNTQPLPSRESGGTAGVVLSFSDISEQRQASLELRLREGAFEAAANAIVLTDRAGRILWVNRAFLDLTGYTASEVVGQTPRVLRSGVHPPEFYRELWDTVLAGRVWRGEIVNRRKDGSTYSEEMTITPLRAGGTEVSHFVAIKQDIGWIRESERRIRESEERLRNLIQNLEAIVWEAEPDDRDPGGFRYSFVSERGDALLGYPTERWLEPGFWLSILHPEDRGWAAEYCAREAAAGRSYELRYRLVRNDGRCVWVHDAVHVIPTANGGRCRLSGVMVDVTRTHELEAALVAASHVWRATFDAMDFAVLLLDGAGCIKRLNRAAQSLLGRAWAECLGRVPWDLEPREPWLAANGVSNLEREEARVRDDQGRSWDVAVQPAPGIGDQAGWRILTLRDVSRVAALQESAARSRTWEAMGSLVAGVAHEVRNPLFAISVNVDALAMMVKDQEHVSELVEALRSERDRLSRLMEDLLHYGRPAAAEMAPLPLEGVLRAALADCASVAAARDVELRRSGDLQGIQVRMNAQRLEEVFCNLVENACQHSPARAQVWIEVSCHGDGGGRWARCQIRDAGRGFPPNDLARVFEPFYTRRKGGTGLGLAIVQRIVLEHGGTVRAENHAAGGATVTVDLPVA